MAKVREIKKIAIVLSGGLARGAAQLAFAKEIVEKVGYDRICVLSGSSIGSINCYSLAVKNYEGMLNFYRKLDCNSTSHFMKKIRNDLFEDAFNNIEGDTIYVPTYITGTRVFGLTCHYFCINNMPREDIKSAINVSMSFPLINGPLRFNHHYWIDGGATDNIPVLPTTYFDPDMVIILHCYPKYYPPENLYLKLRKEAIVIDVDVTLQLPKTITSFSLAKTDFHKMMKIASEEGKKFVEEIFPDFDMAKTKERCFAFTNRNLPARCEKGGDGLMGLVDVLNVLYLLREDIA